MGPAMNLLLAVVLTAVVLYRDAEVPAFEGQPPVVGVVVPGSPAERAGIRSGDRILAVAGRAVNTWDEFLIDGGHPPGPGNRRSSLLRDGQAMTRRVTPSMATAGQSRFEFGDIGVLPDVHPRLLARQSRRARRARWSEGRAT